MKASDDAQPLAIAAGVIAVIVVFTEFNYWYSHPNRPGPSLHIALCGLGILLLAAAYFVRERS